MSIGHNLGAIEVRTMTDAGSTSTFNDDSLENSDNYINGRFIVFTSGANNDGQIRIVDDYVGSTTIGTIRGDIVTDATADGDTYELWDEDIPPTRIHGFINRAIRSVTRMFAPSNTDISIHASTQVQSFALPTSILGIKQVQYRTGFAFETIHQCDGLWGTVDSDVTATLDDEEKREGSASNKFVIAAGLSAGDIIAQDTLDEVDLSDMTHVEFFIKSNVTTTAGQLKLHLSSGTIAANGSGAEESLDVPALTADTFTFVRVALANPETDTAIDNVGLEDDADIGAATVYIDGIIATRDLEGSWLTLHKNYWGIDEDRRRLTFTQKGKNIVSYSLLKLIGVRKPTELNADATNCDIEPEYIIEKATAIALRSRGDRRAPSREADWIEAENREGLAQLALSRGQRHSGMRWIESN